MAARKMKRGFRQLVDEASARIRTVTPNQAHDLVAAGETVLVDLRDIRELQREGRIENAQHCPRGMLEFWIDPESPYHREFFSQDKTFVFFCAAGWRSALATATAQDMGLENVAHIEGGFSAWKEAGLPTVSPDRKQQ